MKKVMCEALAHYPGQAGGNYYPCSFRAKYKIVHKGIHDRDYEMEGYTTYLCGTHYKGRGHNPNETITLIKKEDKEDEI